MGDIIDIKDQVNDNKTEDKKPDPKKIECGLHKICVVNDKDSKWYIPTNLQFVPFTFGEGFECLTTVHARASYLMSCIYEVLDYDDATNFMEYTCKTLNEEVNEAWKENPENTDTFNASFVKPSLREYEDDNGVHHTYMEDCYVDDDSFNEDFIEAILDPDGYDLFLNYLFCSDSFVWNNKWADMNDEEITDMFCVTGNEKVFKDGRKNNLDHILF